MHQETSSASAPAGLDIALIFDLAPIALLVLSPAWRIVKASSRFLAEWRLSSDECVGQELLPFVEQQLRPPRPSYLAQLTTSIDDAIAARAERTCKPINTRYAVSWKARVVPIFKQDELVSIVLEWHEGPAVPVDDEVAEPGLSTDEAFRIFVQAVKDYAIFLLDTKGYIATWNTGAQLLKGYARDEIIGRHFSVFYGKEDLDVKKPEMELEICLREGRVEDEGWRYRKDGSRFWANVIITAVYKDGVHVGFGKVTRDLTERKSAESRLIAAYEESEKLKSDFLANMSHEIRTPMHGMLSACTLLLDTPLSARQRDMVSIMDESGQVLLQVINDILDYSKLTSGSFSMHSDIVGITSIVTSVVRSVQTTLPPEVHFELFLAPDLPRSVQGDPLRYRQILQNLVGNAAKFTEKGCIRVRASVQSEDESTFTILSEVTDTGIGVAEAAAASLFTPFMQFDATTTKQYKGTGLGLSIAKSLTELMGGRIGYRPNPDRHGSVFWFTARFKKIKSLERIQDWKTTANLKERRDRIAKPIVDTEVEEMQEELRVVASIKNLLVVEDNVINQKVILGMLRSMGFRNVGLASNGSEAVKMVRGKPAAYDLVLMDINMPVMDGHAATREIRAWGILVPIVAMTAYALKGDQERCLEQGMNDYIAKPVDKKRLIRVLGKWLLRMTDYRKTFEQRMSELRRNQEALGHSTPALEADRALCDAEGGGESETAVDPVSSSSSQVSQPAPQETTGTNDNAKSQVAQETGSKLAATDDTPRPISAVEIRAIPIHGKPRSASVGDAHALAAVQGPFLATRPGLNGNQPQSHTPTGVARPESGSAGPELADDGKPAEAPHDLVECASKQQNKTQEATKGASPVDSSDLPTVDMPGQYPGTPDPVSKPLPSISCVETTESTLAAEKDNAGELQHDSPNGDIVRSTSGAEDSAVTPVDSQG